MGHIDEIKGFLFDEKIRLSHKATVVVLVMVAFLAVDNIFGFSYYFNVDKKLEHLERLDKIIIDSKSDSTTVSYAKAMKMNILNRNNVIDYFYSFSDFTGELYSSIKNNDPTIQTDNTNEVNIGFDFWFHLTSGGLYYLLSFIISPIILLTDKKTPFLQRIATSILGSAMVFFVGVIFYKACSFIPKFDNTLINYTLNSIIQIGFLIVLSIIGQKKK